MISRKKFIQQLGLAGAGTFIAVPNLLSTLSRRSIGNYGTIDAIGVQLYTLIPLLKNDFEGTLESIAEIGYKELEFAGPYYFSPGSDGSTSGYYGKNSREMKNLLDSLGLTAPSAHLDLHTLEENLEEAIEAAHTVGHTYLVCPFLTADQRSSLDDYRRLADQFNRIGEKCAGAGVTFAYHNHCFEFGELDGEIPYNVLLDSTEPELVKMELDLFWICIAGYDPVDYFSSYPGRFPLVHVKDMKSEMVVEEPLHVFENEEAVKTAMGNLEDVGKGVIDFKRILSHHESAGIQHFFIERDWPPQPMQTIENGYSYLSKLNIG